MEYKTRCIRALWIVALLLCCDAGQVPAQSTTQPTTQPLEQWSLSVAHPSLNDSKLYTCFLAIPKDTAPREKDGFFVRLICVNRKNEIVGRMSLAGYVDPFGRLTYEAQLGPDLIKNSYFLFHTEIGTDDAQLVKLVLGQQKTFRPGDNELIYEPIE
ncbi:MAG: hypothetical protein H7144_17220 [Burkholderiales bacterium]|nr:hypothetical protein [Phycisphaerae bacterium]